MLSYVKPAFVLSVIICAASVTAFRTGAREAEHWVSVDSSELALITNSGQADASLLNAHVERIVSGIAILRLNEEQMADLSRAMHTNFNKCSGFVEHATETDALAWVDRMNAVDNERPAVVYSIDNRNAVNPMLAAASEPQNRQVILDLSAFPNRRYNQASGIASANWIKDKWTALAAGRPGTSVEFFTHPQNTSPQPSIIMTIQGSTYPNEIVVLGAHQDSINLSGQTLPAPGADDDGSGVACLTEVIRVLMAKHFRPKRTVQFMAYAAEEVGLRGSNAIATSYRNANKNVVGVLQLDMTNYKGSLGNDVVIIQDFTNGPQNQFLLDLIAAYEPGLVINLSNCGYACSDHASWSNRGYPASFPFEAPMGDDNPFIHTADDTIAQSGNNATQALKFTKIAISYVGELAKGCLSPHLPCSPMTSNDPRLAERPAL
jgi:leucyl aminopeptidase